MYVKLWKPIKLTLWDTNTVFVNLQRLVEKTRLSFQDDN